MKPRLANRLLHWLLPAHRVEELEGDLEELFEQRVEQVGLRQARWRYWHDVLSLLRPSLMRRPLSPFTRTGRLANRRYDDYPEPFLLRPDMLRNTFKIAWRNLVRNKIYSLLNLTGLAVGLSASVLVLLWVQNEMSFDAYHEGADQTYRVTNTLKVSDEPWVWGTSPLVLGETAQREVPGIERISRLMTPWQPLVFRLGNDLRREEKAAYVDSSWFALFDYSFLVGNARQALAEPNSLVLTETKARNWFGDPAQALGKLVRLDSINLTVRAVVHDSPANSSFRYDVLLPLVVSMPTPNDWANAHDWGNFNYQMFLRTAPTAQPDKIGTQLTQLYRVHKKDSTITASLAPLRSLHFDNSFQTDILPKGNRRTVITLGIVGLMILIIASINYVNLSTAVASQRGKEVGVKKIIGAGRGRLFIQFLSESALLVFLALGLSLLLIALLLPAFNAFTENQFTLDFRNGTLWALLLGSVGVTVLLSGVYPSLLLSSLEPVKVLKGANVLGTRTTWFRQGLVIVQFTISIVLIVSTLIIYRQLRYIQTQDPGYQRDHVLTFQLPWDRGKRTATREFIMAQLRAQPGVVGVTTTNASIIDAQSSHSGSLKWAGKAADFDPTVAQLSVEPEMRSVFDLKLTQGRWFQRDMKLDTANVILNEAAVKALGLKAPVVGQWFEFQKRRGQIIGIAKDFHYRSLHQKIEPMVLFFAPSWQSQIFVKMAPGAIPQVLAAAERVWKERNPDKPFDYTFLDESFARLYQTEQKAGQLFNTFAGIAILISCLGLFGLATFSAERRIKEIGVRKVLGASVLSLVSLLSRDFLKLVIIALMLAVPIAWYTMNQWLQDFAYKVDLEWWIFVLAGLLAIAVALLTVSFQSIRAALKNPVTSLRSE